MAAGEKRETSYYEVALTNRQVVGAFVILLVGLMVSFLAGVLVGRDNDAPRSLAMRVSEVPPNSAPVPLDDVEKLDFFAASGDRAAAESAPGPNEPLLIEPILTESVESEPGESVRADELPAPSKAVAKTPDPMPDQAPARVLPSANLGPGGADTPTPRAITASPAVEGAEAVPKWRRRGQVAKEAEELEKQFANEEAELIASPTAAAGATPDSPAPTSPKPEVKTASPPARSTEREPPAPKGVFMVQVFSSSDAAKARGMLASLKDAGYPAMLLRNEQATPAMYRVRVGPFRDRPAAERVAEELRTKLRVDTWITSE